MRFAALVFLPLLASGLLAAEPKTHRDLAYSDADDEHLELDVYSPAEGEDHPVVVWIHGGGWRGGDKAAVQRKPRAFADEGFVFVSVNYRLVPTVTVKQQAGDIARAVKWVHDHAAEYGGDGDTIFVAGHSAGAHLAALLCTDGRYLEGQGLSLKSIEGCIPVDTAAYDVPRQIESVGPVRARTYTGVFGDADSQRDLSPITHVAAERHIPPFLLLHVADRVDSRARTEAFVKALRAAGVSAQVVPAKGKDHGTINRDLGLPGDKPTQAVLAFLHSVLKKYKGGRAASPQ